MTELELFVVRCYKGVLNAVHASPQKFSATDTPCAVCGKIGHPFKDCEILENVDFLRMHHIQYCLQPNRLQNVVERQLKNVPLHLVETIPNDDDDDASDQEEDQDFRSGEDE